MMRETNSSRLLREPCYQCTQEWFQSGNVITGWRENLLSTDWNPVFRRLTRQQYGFKKHLYTRWLQTSTLKKWEEESIIAFIRGGRLRIWGDRAPHSTHPHLSRLSGEQERNPDKVVLPWCGFRVCELRGGGQLPLMKMTIILLAHANSTTMACSRVQPSSLLWVSVADNAPPCRPGLSSHWKPIVTRWKGLKNRGCKR